MDPVSDIRQRRREEDATAGPSTQSFTKRLEKLDFYPKIGDDYIIKTESGGIGIIWVCSEWCVVSVLSGIIIIILFISELTNYLKVQRDDIITIDSTRNEKLEVNFNISLYEIPCTSSG